MQDYENICDNCGEPFITEDVDAVYCEKCWKEIVGDFLETCTKEQRT